MDNTSPGPDLNAAQASTPSWPVPEWLLVCVLLPKIKRITYIFTLNLRLEGSADQSVASRHLVLVPFGPRLDRSARRCSQRLSWVVFAPLNTA